ncbi:MAG: DUF4926 domain-containing protein [Methylococcaceae bacterium]
MLKIGDLIELITDIPERNLHSGMLGAIVHCHNENNYEIEFSNEDGETLACLALEKKQFMLVWRSETKQWLSAAERVVNLIPNLPEDTAEEILHYACFLSLKKQLPYMTKTTAKSVAL